MRQKKMDDDVSSPSFAPVSPFATDKIQTHAPAVDTLRACVSPESEGCLARAGFAAGM